MLNIIEFKPMFLWLNIFYLLGVKNEFYDIFRGSTKKIVRYKLDFLVDS